MYDRMPATHLSATGEATTPRWREAPAQERDALPTVLVISGAAFMRRHTTALLRREGYHAVEAASVAEALQLYQQVHPRAVVLDGSTLANQGRAALRVLLHVDAAAQVVVVLAQATHADVLAIAQAGARNVLLKPLDPARILQTVRALVAPPHERQHARMAVQTMAEVGFGARPGTPHHCVIEDISAGGVRCKLLASPPGGDPPIGTVAQLRITLPGDYNELAAIGRVVRSIGPGIIAVAFLRLSERDTARITAFCERVAGEAAPR